MKKWLTMVLLLALLLTGCGGTGSGENENGSSDQSAAGHTGGDLAAQAQKDPWGLVLAAEDVTDTGLTLRFVQSGGNPSGELETGSLYWLERETGDDILNILLVEGSVVKVTEDMYTLKEYMEEARQAISAHLANDPVITIAQVRDMFQTSRKSAKPILEYMDSIKVTKKTGAESERVAY